jgi:hypothetical protein
VAMLAALEKIETMVSYPSVRIDGIYLDNGEYCRSPNRCVARLELKAEMLAETSQNPERSI